MGCCMRPAANRAIFETSYLYLLRLLCVFADKIAGASESARFYFRTAPPRTLLLHIGWYCTV